MKILNVILVIIIVILLVMSSLTIIFIHLKFFNQSVYYFSFTPSGINNYLIAFGEYKALFTGTIATCAAYFGMLRLNVAVEANQDKLKQDRFSDWKTILEIRSIEIEIPDPYMKREFIRVRYKLFLQLYQFDFNIKSKEQLITVFNGVFKDLVLSFEAMNKKYMEMGEIYADSNSAYSFESFRFLLIGTVDQVYDSFIGDLREMYIKNLNPQRIIDSSLFKIAVRNHNPNIL